MKTVKLGDLLTTAQLRVVMKIMTETHDDLIRIAKLKDYLNTLADQLETLGVVPEYLAYVIEYQFMQKVKGTE